MKCKIYTSLGNILLISINIDIVPFYFVSIVSIEGEKQFASGDEASPSWPLPSYANARRPGWPKSVRKADLEAGSFRFEDRSGRGYRWSRNTLGTRRSFRNLRNVRWKLFTRFGCEVESAVLRVRRCRGLGFARNFQKEEGEDSPWFPSTKRNCWLITTIDIEAI